MSWTAIENGEKETIFQSEATTETQIAADLKTVVDRMILNREDDAAVSARELLFYINATNGFIRILWWNNETAEGIGNCAYEIWLRSYWETEDDAFNFDKTCRFAIFDFTEDHMLSDEGIPVYDIFLQTELTDVEEVLI